MSDGRASRATLEALWRLLLEDLVAKLQAPKKVAVDLLQVARKFLRDNACGAPDTQAREDLEALYRLYSNALHEALSRPERPAGVLAEARHWLVYHGVRPDIPAAQAATVAKKLSELDLPFTHKPH